MKIKSVLKLLMLAVVLIVSLSFAGCSLVDSGDQFDDSGLSRKASKTEKSGGKPTDFTATVTLFKDLSNTGSEQTNDISDHIRLTGEQLSTTYPVIEGLNQSIDSPIWGLIAGKEVEMTNITNYNLDPLTFDINGSNHSTINIVDEDGNVVVTLEAHGTIVGNIFYGGAVLDMNWTSVGSGINARGKITGDFYWFDGLDEAFEPISLPSTSENPFGIPYGDFKLTGTYN